MVSLPSKTGINGIMVIKLMNVYNKKVTRSNKYIDNWCKTCSVLPLMLTTTYPLFSFYI